MSTEIEKNLELLSKQYKNIQEVAEEIINLQAILNLPKGTELFFSDIHGEYEAFCHIMRNCSGVIREEVHFWLGDQSTRPVPVDSRPERTEVSIYTCMCMCW